jgi:hypothetical protein
MALPEASRRLQATFQAAYDFGLTERDVGSRLASDEAASRQGACQLVA